MGPPMTKTRITKALIGLVFFATQLPAGRAGLHLAPIEGELLDRWRSGRALYRLVGVEMMFCT